MAQYKIYKDENDKFGLKSIDGVIILDAVYDEIELWEKANVIQTRLGEKYYYFNDKKEQILTDEPSCMEQNIPYWEGIGWHKFMVREIVNHISDNHTYSSDAGFVRIDRKEVKDVADMLAANCERIPIKSESIKLLTDRYSYEFGMTIVKLKANIDGVITEKEWMTGIDKLDTLGSFKNSWHYIDKFVTNSKTKLSVKSLYWLKHRYDMKYVVIDDLCFAYGIDDSLADGEVKWIHVEHYNEHCFPGGYEVSDAMKYGTLDELKELIESHDWEADGDPYGGCFFSYCNICYPDERSWEETEKILNYMYELGHKPEELTKCVVENLYGLELSDDPLEEIKFWIKCAQWALARSEFPNDLNHGKTCYDDFLSNRPKLKHNEVQNKIKELDKLFLSCGARTSEQQIKHNMQKINNITDPYDYSIIDTW